MKSWILRLACCAVILFTHNETGYLCVPLMVQGETLGVLCLLGGEQKDGHFVDQQLAVAIGEGIKLALFNIELREELREQAIHDPLTGLYNRRYLEDSLTRELYRAQRQNTSLCVSMLDIDHFKVINDTFGHAAGDALLAELGRILRENLRKSDIACRYGGDEFVLILPDRHWKIPATVCSRSWSWSKNCASGMVISCSNR